MHPSTTPSTADALLDSPAHRKPTHRRWRALTLGLCTALVVGAATISVASSTAIHRTLVAGVSGAVAGFLEVPLLMWLRTVMNYQYRHGGRFVDAFRLLYAQGGFPRLYNGISITLLNTSLARFGEMAANEFVMALLPPSVPLSVQTMLGSAVSVAYRVLIMPLDTLKTTMQVEGRGAVVLLRRKVAADGAGVLFHGALAASLANFVGTYPWFWTFNTLDTRLPPAAGAGLAYRLLRAALLGLSAACASDCCSNSFRVLKTTRQTAAHSLSYAEAARQVVAKDGVRGLFGRGLRTRLAINGLQSALFGVFMKFVQQSWA